jgi:hypothetical protein
VRFVRLAISLLTIWHCPLALQFTQLKAQSNAKPKFTHASFVVFRTMSAAITAVEVCVAVAKDWWRDALLLIHFRLGSFR